jgi:hypothetical protein
MYRDTLKALYVQILKFQASSICFLSKNGPFQLGLDMIRWDDWESSLRDVQKKRMHFARCMIFGRILDIKRTGRTFSHYEYRGIKSWDFSVCAL